MPDTEPDRSEQDHPGVRVPPPLIFVIFLAVGLAVDSAWFDGRAAATGWTVAGVAVAVAGVSLMVASARLFRKSGVNLEPWKPTSALVTAGPYRLSRNPIYLGMAVASAGVAIAASSLAGLAAVCVAVFVIQVYAVAREERYLARRFGADYAAYKARVRPWI